MKAFLIALQFLSRIHLASQSVWRDEDFGRSVLFFPVVGLIIGLLLAALYGASSFLFDAFGRSALVVAFWFYLTGGLHADGYMDTADGLFSGRSRERMLEILKDSHVGAFAVLGCAGYLLLDTALLSELPTTLAPMMIGCFMLSRACSAWAMSAFRNARPKGMLDAFAQAAQRRMLTISCTVYAVLCAVLWAIVGGWLAIPCLLAAILCAWYYRHMSYKQFGGITGDLAGWFLQITELTLTAVIVIGGKLL